MRTVLIVLVILISSLPLLARQIDFKVKVHSSSYWENDVFGLEFTPEGTDEFIIDELWFRASESCDGYRMLTSDPRMYRLEGKILHFNKDYFNGSKYCESFDNSDCFIDLRMQFLPAGGEAVAKALCNRFIERVKAGQRFFTISTKRVETGRRIGSDIQDDVIAVISFE